jgi:ferredoxin
LQINRGADITSHAARQTTDKAGSPGSGAAVREEDGLIHVVINKQDVDQFICNCCPCCCQTMPVLIKHNISVIELSRFGAQVDPDLCSSCGACLDRCYFSAIAQEGEETRPSTRKAMGCGLCQVTCPSDAISMTEVRPRDFVPEKLFG